ncbi:hypothetical protein [Nitrospirillum amazonense]|uniref:hypothetical protein n=1 Tax=Nitrospirillum amazonense TaxID=28077 RepID=UPI0024128479|nr:hypothetical protein [Nitrospirillum amazonense]MDG3442458.1 hypothetical protein [Nitrospirillum amazonense]
MDWLDEANRWLPLASFLGPGALVVVGLAIKGKLATKEDVAKLGAERIASDEAFKTRLDNLEKQSRDRITAVEKSVDERMAKVEQTCAAVEAEIRHLPDQDALTDLRDRVAGVETELKGATAGIEGLHALMERIERPLNLLLEHHLKKGD